MTRNELLAHFRSAEDGLQEAQRNLRMIEDNLPRLQQQRDEAEKTLQDLNDKIATVEAAREQSEEQVMFYEQQAEAARQALEQFDEDKAARKKATAHGLYR